MWNLKVIGERITMRSHKRQRFAFNQLFSHVPKSMQRISLFFKIYIEKYK